MRIVIAGPDGSGKSSVCFYLADKLKPSVIIHAVKDRDHFFKSTTYAFKIWKLLSKFGYLGSFIGRFFVFYPFEYLENIFRFKKKNNQINYYIYDRHPIDRIIMLHELRKKKLSGKISKIRFILEYPIISYWAWKYINLFPHVDIFIVLLPDPNVCLNRAKGQFKNLESVQLRINSYTEAINDLKNKQMVKAIYFDSSLSVRMLGEMILNEIKKFN